MLRSSLGAGALIVLAACSTETEGGAGQTGASPPAAAAPLSAIPIQSARAEVAQTEAGRGGGRSVVPTYQPVPRPPGASSIDIGYEGRLSFEGGCIRMTSANGAATILIFPAGEAQWRTPGRELVVQGTVFRDGDVLSSGGSTTSRDFWTKFPSKYQQHTPVPENCTAESYLLVSGPVTRSKAPPS